MESKTDLTPDIAAQTNGNQFVWADYRFTDPQWLTWWLGSLHMLPPSQQMEVANRLKETLYLTDVQVVLEEFIEDLQIAYGSTEQVAPQKALAQSGTASRWLSRDQDEPRDADEPWFERVMTRLMGRFKPVMVLLVIFLGMALFGVFLPSA